MKPLIRADIKKPQRLGAHVEIGGFDVKLLFENPGLFRLVKSDFHCSSRPVCRRRGGAYGRADTIMTLAIHSSASASCNDVDLAQGMHFDGEGEYVARFDSATRRGVIRLTGHNPTLALANFIRRIFARLVIDNKGAVFHCACVVRNGAAHLFFGKSGSGKSTVCKLLRDDTIAGDDLTVVRLMGGRMLAWGLPAFRSPLYQLSRGVFPVRAAFTLAQDCRNFIRNLDATAAIAGMLAFSTDLSQPKQAGKIVDLLARLVHNVPCRELHFRKDRLPGLCRKKFWNTNA